MTLEEIEKYAEESVSSIYYLLLSVADVKDVHADHAASHLGKAQGIANILRYGATVYPSVPEYEHSITFTLIILKHNMFQVCPCIQSP